MYRAYITLSILVRRIYTLQGVIKIFINSNKYDILLEHCLRTHLECNSKCFLYLWNCQDCPSRKMHGKLIYSFMHLKNSNFHVFLDKCVPMKEMTQILNSHPLKYYHIY